MYREFFGLRERPFDLTSNPRFLVLTDAHREALSNLNYGIASRKGVTLLLGEAGTGKTTVIRAALKRQPEQVHCVHLHNPALTRAEFIEMLAGRFELSEQARTSKTTLLVELEMLMRRRHKNGEATVLIIDEAQTLSLDLLEEVRLLANIETDEMKLLSLVLAGQPELAGRLNQDSLKQLKQRVALRCSLRPLNLTETLGYVAGRIQAAGGAGEQVFTREAVTMIHERSRGIPRTISVIADNALVAGFALGRRPVSRAIVDEVCRDLDLPGTPIDSERLERTTLGQEARSGDGPAEPRVLAFDTAAAEASKAAAADTPKAVRGASGGHTETMTASHADSQMFSGMYPKRRRFFSFMRQG
jgi:general secretion pathway protein A